MVTTLESEGRKHMPQKHCHKIFVRGLSLKKESLPVETYAIFGINLSENSTGGPL